MRELINSQLLKVSGGVIEKKYGNFSAAWGTNSTSGSRYWLAFMPVDVCEEGLSRYCTDKGYVNCYCQNYLNISYEVASMLADQAFQLNGGGRGCKPRSRVLPNEFTYDRSWINHLDL